MALALQQIYPEHPWDQSKFKGGKTVVDGHWESLANQRIAMDELAKKLSILYSVIIS
jgi:hypothetical protein